MDKTRAEMVNDIETLLLRIPSPMSFNGDNINANIIEVVGVSVASIDDFKAGNEGLQPADKIYLEDILFTRHVLTRHVNKKPENFTFGTGENLKTVHTTQDINGNTETELLI